MRLPEKKKAEKAGQSSSADKKAQPEQTQSP